MNTTQPPTAPRSRRLFSSIAILLASLGLAYAPIPGLQQTLIVVSGTELQEPLTKLKERFEAEQSSIRLELKFQGSQDVINNYIDDKNDFDPAILIPAEGELLQDLSDRWQAQAGGDPFHEPPRPIAKTRLVAIAWPQRGQVLFNQGQFQWPRLEQALTSGHWSALGGSSDWGSFDLIMTDPTRSNSGQLTLSLWVQQKLGGGSLDRSQLGDPQVQTLVNLVKRSVYQPPRSTDVLLQEFIARGLNDADVATVYESIALYRWSQSQTSQGRPYQIYYLNPTIETVSTAAIVRRNVDGGQAKAASTFLNFLTEPAQQAVFVQHGFRPTQAEVQVDQVPNTPWQQNIPGVQVNPKGKIMSPPSRQTVSELIRLWQRGN
jgi:hypothetical protein